jgi:nucleotide-binding universal stress UspA family protein
MARVLIASDGSDFSIRGAVRALELLGTGCEVTVLNVISPPLLPGGAPIGPEGVTVPVSTPENLAEIDDALVHEANAAVDRTVRELGIDAERRVVHGEPAHEICRVAADGQYDVVVIGSHGAGIVRRMLTGSVSNHVVHHAPCAVLVMREQA